MTDAAEKRAYDGCSIVAVLVALAGVLAMTTVPLLAFPVGVVAIALALVSRRRLRADDRLRGAGLGLIAFVVGGIEVASVFFPPLLNGLITGLDAIPVR